MPVTVYHYPACSTCRKALAWLDRKGIAHTRVDIVKEPPPRGVLARVLEQSGGNLRALFNTSGQSYREGNFKERLPALTREQALEALSKDGKLIKRPLLISDKAALAGFDETVWGRALL